MPGTGVLTSCQPQEVSSLPASLKSQQGHQESTPELTLTLPQQPLSSQNPFRYFLLKGQMLPTLLMCHALWLGQADRAGMQPTLSRCHCSLEASQCHGDRGSTPKSPPPYKSKGPLPSVPGTFILLLELLVAGPLPQIWEDLGELANDNVICSQRGLGLTTPKCKNVIPLCRNLFTHACTYLTNLEKATIN